MHERAANGGDLGRLEIRMEELDDKQLLDQQTVDSFASESS